MKVAVISDTHAGARQESVHFNNYFFKFWDNVFFPYLEEHGIKNVLHLGDLVDRRKFMNYVIANSWRKNFFNRLSTQGYNATFLVGNHDVPFRNTNSPNAIEELLKGRYDFPIITAPVETDFYGITVGLVPWINSGNYQESLNFIKNTKATILFGHFEIAGFEMDKGHLCETGFDKKLFERFAAVYSGHFHTKSTDGTIFYLGAQYEMTWSDYGDVKGFHVFDTEDCSLTFVPNPYKMFHKVWYNDSEQNLESWKKFDFSELTERYVKVIVTNKNNPFLFDKVMEMLYDASPLDVMIADDYGTIYEESNNAVDQAEDTMTIVSKYIDNLAVDKHISKDRLKNFARELYVEALGMEGQQQ